MVLLYAAAPYPLWRAELDQPELGPGGFGENMTVADPSEATACIGDAAMQVTGPRPFLRWTVALVNAYAHGRATDRAVAAEIAACPTLHEFWQTLILRQTRPAVQ